MKQRSTLGYSCQDCSYQGRQFRQGRCPACGSANIVNNSVPLDEKKRSPLGLMVCIILWLYLGGVLVKRFAL